MEAHVDGPALVTMTIRIENVAGKYRAAKKPSRGTAVNGEVVSWLWVRVYLPCRE
jgi:hypothetical protein